MSIDPSATNPATGKAYAVNPESGNWDDNYFARTYGSGSGGSSDRYEPLDLSSVPSSLEFAKELSSTEDLYLQALTQRMEQRQKPEEIYGKLETEAGLPELRASSSSLSKEINSLEDTIRSIEPGVAARSRESLLTQAQRDRQVTAEKEPLIENLARLSTNLSRIGSQITSGEQGVLTRLGLIQQGQEQELEPLKLRYTATIDRNARYLSAFSSDKETELNKLMAEWQRRGTVADQDWNRMNELADMENTYIKELQKSAAQAGAKISGSESAGDLLSLIGSQAADLIAFEQAQANKTGSGSTATAKKEEAKKQALVDIRGGWTLADVVSKYAHLLSVDEITQIYAASSPYGTPQEDWAKVVLGLEVNDGNGSDDDWKRKLEELQIEG